MVFRELSSKLRKLSVVTGLIIAFVLPAVPFGQAIAAPSNTPDSSFPNTDASVNAMTTTADGSTYIGGTFTTVNPTYVAKSGVFDASTGAPSTFGFPNQTVYASVQDGTGGWYIGGQFSSVSGVTRNKLAHINSDGSLDLSFDPNLNNTVRALEFDQENNILYVGGYFNTVNGSTNRQYLAAIDGTTGIATSFDAGVSGYVNSLILDEGVNTLYVGGNFWDVNGGTTREKVAAINTNTGLASSFSPLLDDDVYTMALDSTSDTLYLGGVFTMSNGVTRNSVAAVSTLTGANTAFNPNVSGGAVRSIALDASTGLLYIGGDFTNVNGATTRNSVAAISTVNGIATSFDPNLNGNVEAIILNGDKNKLYVGGNFTSVNAGTTRNRMAAFDTSTGVATAFNPNMSGTVYALAFSEDQSKVYAVGAFNFSRYGAIFINRIARIDSSGVLDPTFNADVAGTVNSLAYDEDTDTLYAGGSFTTVNTNATRNRIAAFNGSTGVVTAFDPNVGATVNSIALDPTSDTLYAGGNFDTVNGATPRVRLAAFDSGTGTVKAFDAGLNGTVLAITLDIPNNLIYVGGSSFDTVNGNVTRNKLASFDMTTGVVTSFNPDVGSNVQTLLLDESSEVLYFGGSFTTVNSNVTRNRLAAVSTDTGTVTSFDPNLSGTVSALAVDATKSLLYVGGSFNTVNGSTTRNNLAALDINTGEATSFNPNLISANAALAFSPDGYTLYVGGSFTKIGDSYRTYLAAFQDPDLDNDGTPNTEEQAAPNNGDANNDSILDSQQANVTSILNTDSNQYVTIVSPSGTTLSTTTAEAAPTEDGFTHLFGLTGFTISGVTPGDTIEVSLFYPNPNNLDPTTLTPKKYFPSTTSYQDLPATAPTSTTLTNQTIDGQPTLNLTYNLTDGGDYDLDSTADGQITDPVSLATTNQESETLADTGQDTNILILIATSFLVLALYKARKVYV